MSFRRPTIHEFPYFSKYDNLSSKINPDWLLPGCRAPDCIPSIDDPNWADTSEALDTWSRNEDVLVLIYPKQGTNNEIDLESYTFPITILDYHEIVNFDASEGTKIAMTYCPLCQTATAYYRELEDRVLEMGVSGLLYNSALFIYDRKTLSLFSQVYSEGVMGEFVGKKLNQLPVIQTTLGEVVTVFPKTKVLSKQTGFTRQMQMYGQYPYRNYKKAQEVNFPTFSFDNKLHSKELTFHFEANNKNYIIPVATFEKQIEPVIDSIITVNIAGGRLFFSLNDHQKKLLRNQMQNKEIPTHVEIWNNWIPALISFYFASRSYYPQAELL